MASSMLIQSCMPKYAYFAKLEGIQVNGNQVSTSHIENDTYTDNKMKAKFEFTPVDVIVRIYNDDDKPIYVIWDKCSYIDAIGNSHKVIRDGVRIMDKELSQANSIIPPKSHIRGVIIPSSTIHLPTGTQIGALAQAYRHDFHLGNERENRVYLTIERDGVHTHYDFKLSVRAQRVASSWEQANDMVTIEVIDNKEKKISESQTSKK